MYMVPNAILVIKAEICTGLYDLVTPNELRAVANQSKQQGFNTIDRDLFLGHDIKAEIYTGLYDPVTPNELRAVAKQQGFNTTDRDLFLEHDVQAMSIAKQ